MRLSNPQSPLNAYSRVVNSDFSVRSIQHLDDNSALVRFTLLMTNKDGMTAKLNKVATVGIIRTMDVDNDEWWRQSQQLHLILRELSINIIQPPSPPPSLCSRGSEELCMASSNIF